MPVARFLLAYSLIAVVLYACALPLWQGWDEPFHYGYVETLAVEHDIPRLGKSTLSQEISDSLTRTPLPAFLAQAVPGSVSVQQWPALSPGHQIALRTSLRDIPPATRMQRGPNPNYEAHQAPLAYLIVAAGDMLLQRLPLVRRVLWLRVALAVASMVFVFAAVSRLARTLRLTDAYRHRALFCCVSVQVLWASLSHIGNDAIAIPLTIWFLVHLAEARAPVCIALVLAAGLLTKAYFLCFLPVFLLFCLVSAWRRVHSWPRTFAAMFLVLLLAGPWYARNLKYGSFSGTQESASGVSFGAALEAVPHIAWVRGTFVFLRNTLWLGNWSYTPFPRGPITALLLLLAIAFGIYVYQWKRVRSPEVWVWGAAACFVGGLVYQTGATWVHTGGHTLSVDPWYWQGVVLALWVLFFCGLQRCGILGNAIAGACYLLTTGIAAWTFLGMLLPEYGAGLAKASTTAKLRWWETDALADISRVSLAPAPVVLGLLVLFIGLLLLNSIVLTRTWKQS